VACIAYAWYCWKRECRFQEKGRRHCGVVTSKARQTHSSVFCGGVIFSNSSSTHKTNKAKKNDSKREIKNHKKEKEKKVPHY